MASIVNIKNLDHIAEIFSFDSSAKAGYISPIIAFLYGNDGVNNGKHQVDR